MEGMAHVGMGEPFIITKPEGAAEQAEKFRKYIQSPVLTDINVSFHGFDAYDVEPENVPDVLAERPIIISGKWRGSDKGAIKVTGMSAQGEFSQTVSVAEFPPNPANSALRYLWARQRIQLLADYNNLEEDSGRVKEVTKLGLKYNLLTNYTSFVAIDQKVRNVGGRQEVVEQALPMPEGVSDYAVGGGAATGFAGGGYGMGKSVKDGGWLSYDASQAPAYAVRGKKSGELTAEYGRADTAAVSGSVQIGRIQVTSGLSERAIRNVVEKKLAGVKADYAVELSSQPRLKGKMVVEFVVRADGTVRDVKVTMNQLTAGLEKKLIRYFEKFAFPQPTGGEATVKVTFNFKP
jgi:Ca-activated chloride channel family protein